MIDDYKQSGKLHVGNIIVFWKACFIFDQTMWFHSILSVEAEYNQVSMGPRDSSLTPDLYIKEDVKWQG